MAVFTQKEYTNLNKKSTTIKPKKEILIPDVISSGEIKKSPEEIFKYYLLHPENGVMGNLQNFEDVIKLEGKEYKRICKRGVVITTEKPLANFLIKKGYILMEKIKIEE